jgi:hypothetical protein
MSRRAHANPNRHRGPDLMDALIPLAAAVVVLILAAVTVPVLLRL